MRQATSICESPRGASSSPGEGKSLHEATIFRSSSNPARQIEHLTNRRMDLEDFIAQTLISIKKGIAKANDGDRRFEMLETFRGEKLAPPAIKFDVAVVASSSSKAGAKVGITVVGINLLGVDGSLAASDQTVSRIQFGVTLGTALD